MKSIPIGRSQAREWKEIQKEPSHATTDADGTKLYQ